MQKQQIRDIIAEQGLKVTPQRMAVLEAIDQLHNHPAADQVIGYIRRNYPNIATGTVYKVLETLAEHRIINKVKTDRDIMRYDADVQKHHHIYCIGSDTITDYYDDKLTRLLNNYFRKNKLSGFKIEDIQLQIIGRYEDSSICR